LRADNDAYSAEVASNGTLLMAKALAASTSMHES